VVVEVDSLSESPAVAVSSASSPQPTVKERSAGRRSGAAIELRARIGSSDRR
jgi:hypothetical protein